MERFVRGDIVVTPFPFSDLTSTIKRPALIVAVLPGDDLIVCQITTKEHNDKFNISLKENDLSDGNLKVNSFIRASKLLTIRKSIILYKLGTLKLHKLDDVMNKILSLFQT